MKPVTIGQKLKQLRESVGMSPEKLAEIMETTRPTIGNWESDTHKISFEMICKYCTYFGVNIREFQKFYKFKLKLEAQS